MGKLLDSAPPPDYVAVPRERGVSRGRKVLIGIMAVSAFTALTSGGTFASFTASTDNAGANDTAGSNPFETGRFELLNTILNADGTTKDNSGPGASPNCSSATDDAADGTTDNHAVCDYLFKGNTNAIVASSGISTYVKVENAGDTGSGDGKLIFSVSPTGACVVGSLATSSNCSNVYVTIQEYGVSASRGTGDAAPAFTDGNRVAECVFGGIGTVDTATTPDSFTSADADADVVDASVANEDVCKYGRPLSALPAFANYVTIDRAMPAADGTTPNLNNDVRYFKLHVQMPQTNCGTVDAPSYSGANDTAAPLGFHDTTGLGCHNSVQNTSATFTVRWMLIEKA